MIREMLLEQPYCLEGEGHRKGNRVLSACLNILAQAPVSVDVVQAHTVVLIGHDEEVAAGAELADVRSAVHDVNLQHHTAILSLCPPLHQFFDISQALAHTKGKMQLQVFFSSGGL